MKLTSYGHSCFGMEAKGTDLRFDPFVAKKDANVASIVARLDETYGENPGENVIDFGDLCTYFPGDSALTMDMQMIAREFKVDKAFLPFGNQYKACAKYGIIAADFLGYENMIEVDYETFTQIEIDRDEVEKEFEEAGNALTLRTIGETIKI